MRRKLSTAVSRSELIASYAYGQAALATPPPPPLPVKAPVKDKPTPPAADKPYEPAPYHADADETVICPGCQKHNDLDASYCDQCGAKLAGSTEVKIDPPPAAEADPEKPEPPVPAKTAVLSAPVAPGTAAPVPANPVDEKGNVHPAAVCANPDCQHLASSHTDDLSAGQNTGPCQMSGCACPGMQVDSDQATGDDQGDPGAETAAGAMAPPGAAPDTPLPPGPPDTGPAPTLNTPPPVAGSENMGPAFTIPVAIIEGQPTGDGREIAAGALTWRTPPLPLMGLATETHDPEGFDMNDPAVMCGRIDSFERIPGEGDTQVILARGFYLANDDGAYFASLTEGMGRCGISADVAVQSSEIQVGDIDEDGWPTDMSETMTEGEIMGLTQVPFPAFAGAYIVLGDGSDKPEATPIPQQSDDAPTVPEKPPAAVTAGRQLVHLMSYEQCERCQQGDSVITAAGGPAAPPRAWFENPNFTEGDGRLAEILDRRGQRALGGKYACPLTITDEGRVYGHLAPWGVCHIGKPGCVTAPPSKSDYAYFKRGQHVVCADGSKVRVGTLTVNAGHADVHASSTSAMAHYDNIAMAAADVNAGEDEHGIWIAGAIRPTATADQVAALRASSVSGDWRGLGGNLELVAALAVPVPGFPHAVVAGAQEDALVAAGAGVMHRLKHPVIDESDRGDVALRRALSPLLKTSREAARGRLSVLRA